MPYLQCNLMFQIERILRANRALSILPVFVLLPFKPEMSNTVRLLALRSCRLFAWLLCRVRQTAPHDLVKRGLST